jgi:hypothetical protein
MLGRAGRAAAIGLIFQQEGLEASHDLGPFGIEILPLRQVFSEVVEFAGVRMGFIISFLLEPVGLPAVAVAIPGGGIDEDPLGLADEMK